MEADRIDIPEAWLGLDFDALAGTILLLGASDTGKTTFARFLTARLRQEGKRIAYLDGDPGQSTLGVPTTLSLALGTTSTDQRTWRTFVGALSPVGHMLWMLTAAARLLRAAGDHGADVVVYDTTGFIDLALGGHYLKLAKVELFAPTRLVAFQRDRELEGLLQPLRRSGRLAVDELPISAAVRARSREQRRAHRAQKFAAYFRQSEVLTVSWRRLAVFPGEDFRLHQLVAVEDREGFVLALGLIEEIDRVHQQILLRTPLASLEQANALRLGSIQLDPGTFAERRLPRRLSP